MKTSLNSFSCLAFTIALVVQSGIKPLPNDGKWIKFEKLLKQFLRLQLTK